MSDGPVHEIWIDEEDLDMCCLAGPDGSDARALHGPNARLEAWTRRAITATSIDDVFADQ